MSDTPAQTLVKAMPVAKPISVSTQSSLLLRKCLCGGSAGVDGECEECREKKLTVQRHAINGAELPGVGQDMDSEQNSQGPSLDAGTHADESPGLAYDFSRMRVHAATRRIQTKLTVNEPGDEYEQEADEVAEQVMRMEAPEISQEVETTRQAENLPIQRLPLEGERIHRQEEEEEPLQAKEVAGERPAVAPELQTRIASFRGAGQSLPEATRAFMEPRFGYDFSQVRIHTDAQAAETARAIHAKAYTVGRDIVFGEEQYSPGTTEGRLLLAHELTHTLQQQPSTLLVARNGVSNHPISLPTGQLPQKVVAPTSRVIVARSISTNTLSAAGTGTSEVIARQVTKQQSSDIQEDTPQPESSVESIVEELLRRFHTDSQDNSGQFRSLLASLNSATRTKVLNRLRFRVSSLEWKQITRFSAEFAPSDNQEPLHSNQGEIIPNEDKIPQEPVAIKTDGTSEKANSQANPTDGSMSSNTTTASPSSGTSPDRAQTVANEVATEPEKIQESPSEKVRGQPGAPSPVAPAADTSRQISPVSTTEPSLATGKKESAQKERPGRVMEMGRGISSMQAGYAVRRPRTVLTPRPITLFSGGVASPEVAGLLAELQSVAMQRKESMSEETEELKAKIAANGRTQQDAIHAETLKVQATIKGEIDLTRIAISREVENQKVKVAATADAGFASVMKRTEEQIEVIKESAAKYKKKASDSATAKRESVRKSGSDEGKRGKEAMDKQAEEARKRGQVKASGYPNDEQGKVQAEAVQKVAEEAAAKLAEPGQKLEADIRDLGNNLADALQGEEDKVVKAIDDQSPQLAEELLKQARGFKTQFDTLVREANKGLDKFAGQMNRELDEVENTTTAELQTIETGVAGQIDAAVSRIQEKVDNDTATVMSSIDTVVTTTAGVTRSRQPNIAHVQSVVKAARGDLDQIVGQFTAGLGEIEAGTREHFSKSGSDIIIEVTKLGTNVSGSLAKITAATSDGMGTFSKNVKEGSDRLGQEWETVLAKAQETVEAKYSEAIAGMERGMDKGVLEAKNQLTGKVNAAIKKNQEPLDQLDAKMEEAAKEAREKYNAKWYKKLLRWVWSAIKAIVWTLLKLIGFAILFVLAIVAIVVGIIEGSIALIVVGIIGLVALLGLMIYGFIAGIIRRIRSADTWWQGIWGFFVGVLDFFGIPKIIEGLILHDIVNGHKLTVEEAGDRFGEGVVELAASFTIILRLVKFIRGPVAPPLLEPPPPPPPEISPPPEGVGVAPEGKPAPPAEGASPEGKPATPPERMAPEGVSPEGKPATPPEGVSPEGKPEASIEGMAPEGKPAPPAEGASPAGKLEPPGGEVTPEGKEGLPSEKPEPGKAPTLRQSKLMDPNGELTQEGIEFLRNHKVYGRRFLDMTDEEVRYEFRNEKGGKLLEEVVKEENKRQESEMGPSGERIVFDKKGQTLSSIAKALAKKIPIDMSVLSMETKEFVETYMADILDFMDNHPDMKIRNSWREFVWGEKKGGKGGESAGFLSAKGKVGRKAPDLVEVLLDRLLVIVTDTTHRVGDPIHNFKTLFYSLVLEKITGFKTGAADYRSLFRQAMAEEKTTMTGKSKQ